MNRAPYLLVLLAFLSLAGCPTEPAAPNGSSPPPVAAETPLTTPPKGAKVLKAEEPTPVHAKVQVVRVTVPTLSLQSSTPAERALLEAAQALGCGDRNATPPISSTLSRDFVEASPWEIVAHIAQREGRRVSFMNLRKAVDVSTTDPDSAHLDPLVRREYPLDGPPILALQAARPETRPHFAASGPFLLFFTQVSAGTKLSEGRRGGPRGTLGVTPNQSAVQFQLYSTPGLAYRVFDFKLEPREVAKQIKVQLDGGERPLFYSYVSPWPGVQELHVHFKSEQVTEFRRVELSGLSVGCKSLTVRDGSHELLTLEGIKWASHNYLHIRIQASTPLYQPFPTKGGSAFTGVRIYLRDRSGWTLEDPLRSRLGLHEIDGDTVVGIYADILKKIPLEELTLVVELPLKTKVEEHQATLLP